MSFKGFQNDIKNDSIGNVCLLSGKESLLTEWAQGEIIKRYVNDASKALDLTELDGLIADEYRVVESCETLPFMSEKKLVFVDRLPALTGEKVKKGPEGKKDDEAEERLKRYIKNPSASTILVFTCGEKLARTSGLYKAIAKYGKIYEFTQLTERELKSWIGKRMKKAGKLIDSRMLAYLIESSGYFEKDSDYTLHHFENDISKIILHSEGSEVTEADIDIAITGNMNRDVFKMIELISAGNKKAAFDMLKDMMTYGDNTFGILALLWRQYENILNVKLLSDEGAGLAELMRRLKSQDFVIKKWKNAGRAYTEGRLREILSMIHETDLMIKSGNMEERMALELLVAKI